MQRNRLLPLLAVLTGITLLLAACGDSPAPATPTAIVVPTPAATATSAPPAPATSAPPAPATSTLAATSAPLVDTNPAKPDDATQARVRVAQCVHDAPHMDIYLDGKIPVDAGIPLSNIAFTTTRYEYVSPGTHRVAVVPTGQDLSKALLAPLDVPLAAGHRYTVVVLGQKDDPEHKALVIDQTAAFQAIGAKPTDLAHITVNNLKGVQGIDYTLAGVLRERNVPYGGFQAVIWPVAWTRGDVVSVSGAPDKVLVKEEDSSFHTPGLDNLDCWGGSYPGAIGSDYDNIPVRNTSALNIVAFLQGFTDASGKNGGSTPSFKSFLAAIKTAGLTDMLANGGPYMVFAPSDEAFAALPKDQREALMADPHALADLVRRQIVAGYYPPFTLTTGVWKGYFDRTVTNMLGEQLAISGSDDLIVNGYSLGTSDNAMVANGTHLYYGINRLLPAPAGPASPTPAPAAIPSFSAPMLFIGHSATVFGVAFSPDGKYLATGSVDGTVRLWDPASGKSIRVISCSCPKAFNEVAFSPDGKYLASGSDDYTAHMWDVATGQLIRTFAGHAAEVPSVVFSLDGKYLLTGSPDRTARLWDVATGQTVRIFSGHTDVVNVARFSPDGKYVATGSLDGTARLWDAGTGQQLRVLSGHTGPVNGVAYSPDGKYVATSGDDKTVLLWDAATGQQVRVFSGHERGQIAVAFSPDGRYLLTGSGDRTARLWDVASGATVQSLKGHTSAVVVVAFSPDGRYAATGSEDTTARIWNLQPTSSLAATAPAATPAPTTAQVAPVPSVTAVVQFTGHTDGLVQASFSPDGKSVATASWDQTARIWDAATGRELLRLTGHSDVVGGAVFSPDGKTLLTTSVDATARLWDVATGKEQRVFTATTGLNKGAFAPDGKYIVATAGDGADVWAVATGKSILTFTGHAPAHPNRLAFTPDGKAVVTGGSDGLVLMWEPLSGKVLMTFKGHTAVVGSPAISPDGKYLVTPSNDGTARLWEVASGKELRRFEVVDTLVEGAAFSPDGRFLATSGSDGLARLWDVQSGQEVRRFVGHSDEVRTVVFSPDGKYILTASLDHTARLWLTGLNDTIR